MFHSRSFIHTTKKRLHSKTKNNLDHVLLCASSRCWSFSFPYDDVVTNGDAFPSIQATRFPISIVVVIIIIIINHIRVLVDFRLTLYQKQGRNQASRSFDTRHIVPLHESKFNSILIELDRVWCDCFSDGCNSMPLQWGSGNLQKRVKVSPVLSGPDE